MAHELNTTAVTDKADISGTDLLFGAAGSSDLSPQPYTFSAIQDYVLDGLALVYAPLSHTHAASAITDFAEAVDDRVNALFVAGSNITLTYNDGDGTFTVASTAAGVTDGDKGDVVVSGGGATWTVDDQAITYAKIQNISATSRILGRKTAGAGLAEELTGSDVATIIGLGSAAYEATSAFAAASHTQAASTITDFAEAVDDRVNSLLVAGSNVTLTYNDAANTLTIAASGGGSSSLDYGLVTGSVTTTDDYGSVA